MRWNSGGSDIVGNESPCIDSMSMVFLLFAISLFICICLWPFIEMSCVHIRQCRDPCIARSIHHIYLLLLAFHL